MPRDRGGAAVWEEREDPPLCLSAAGASLGCTESSRPHSSRQPRGHSIHAQENARIMKGLTVRKTFVLGSYAFRLSPVEKKKYNDMTHKWTCLLRALNGEDLTYCVKKVVFELDPSFVNPKRTLTHPPYEVSEAGWGEFQISVKVHFLDDSLPPAELRHFLRLNPEGGHVVGPCVAAETLDEVLIHEPKESFYDVLMEGPHKPAAPHHLEKFFLQQQPRFDEQMKLLMGAQGVVQAESMSLMSEAFALTHRIRQLQAACDPRVFQHLRAQQAAVVSPPVPACDLTVSSPSTAAAMSPGIGIGLKETLSLAAVAPGSPGESPAQTGVQAPRGAGPASSGTLPLGANPLGDLHRRVSPPEAAGAPGAGADVSAPAPGPDGSPQPFAEAPGTVPPGAPAAPYAVVGAAFGAQGADEKTPMLDAQALQQQMVLQQQQAQVLLQQQLYHAQQQQYLMHAAPGVFFPSDAKRGAGAPCPQQVSPFAQPPGPYPNGGSAPGNQGVVFPRAPDAAAQASSSVPHKE
ncbi:Gas41, putative [Toxoplasma gondii ME49]|uniref:Gas41, putative n=7 Tax=Toxoplasma gondii TaxID=5811 RepID=A0A125YVF1_TOXGM|nr:Gas41, putative [Toxoplasma gondii ME49]EPR60080.1 putative Gas41 [Toxoplasma gondii GT1]KAF4639965.1 putative Gas41 [Toxoplasma gondii]KFG36187.1 putative Gas41 [Toxoplasma gondii GAB2-2007-GAL-DOM2]KFG41239.1 putative Gas41 [Toxoplasma gondii p89]PIL99135.1 putative Gas41 [Toxoplasma gondii COUG]|eukprot:XP_002370892.1 Gas41, putative [Toxoplasma gondii ME49]